MKINFYLEGAIAPPQADYDLTEDGSLIPNHGSQNKSLECNVVLIVDSVGITAQQVEVIDTFARMYEVAVHLPSH